MDDQSEAFGIFTPLLLKLLGCLVFDELIRLAKEIEGAVLILVPILLTLNRLVRFLWVEGSECWRSQNKISKKPTPKK